MKQLICLLAAVAMMPGVFAQDQEAEVIDAMNLEALRAKENVEVVVEGQVTQIGKTKEDTITFINVGLPKKEGFVALVYQKDYGVFPDGFDKYRGQRVRVKGVIKLYKGEIPQIALKSPDQITVVPAL